MKSKKIIIFFLPIMWLFSCSNNELSGEDILAKTESQVLYKSEVISAMPISLNSEDSTEFVKRYVENWLHSALLFEKAFDNIADTDSSIAKQVDIFRKELYINKYEQLFLQQKLDTLIPQKEIDEYYSKHKNEFLLTETVIKPIVVVFPIEQKQKIEYVEKNFFSKKKGFDIDDLKDYCFNNCQKFSFADNWVSMQALRQEMPIGGTKFTIGKFTKIKDTENVYFINITEQVSEGTPMPVELAHDQIAKILLQVRKIELLKNMRNKVYQDATHKKQYEIFY
ncbi:MAG: hypothetical protein MJ198_09625 [Bacteroidales bacterium]|nr:hypothetical protein [Bacteroidales bacterium]